MKIETVYEKGVREINEDALLVADPTFGVFDGVSGLEKYKNSEGKTGAWIASHIAAEAFRDTTRSLVECARTANNMIAAGMADAGIDTTRKVALWGTTAAVVRIGKDSFDWIQIADSLILLIYKDDSFKLLTPYFDQDLETMLMAQDLATRKVENVRALLEEQVFKIRNTINISYGALDGEPQMEKFLKSGTEPLLNIAHIILFTDGIFIPKEDPNVPDDIQTFVRLFLEGGLKKVHTYVRALEEGDPNLWKYPRFKQHDDIGAIAISL